MPDNDITDPTDAEIGRFAMSAIDRVLTIAERVSTAYAARLDREVLSDFVLPGEYPASTDPSADDIVPGTIRTLPDGMKITTPAVSADLGNVLSVGSDGRAYLSAAAMAAIVEAAWTTKGAITLAARSADPAPVTHRIDQQTTTQLADGTWVTSAWEHVGDETRPLPSAPTPPTA